MAEERRQLYPADGNGAHGPFPDHECGRYLAAIPRLRTLWRSPDRRLPVLAVAASPARWTEHRGARHPGAQLLVAAHPGYPGLSQLPALFQTPAYPAGIPERLLCAVGTAGPDSKHAFRSTGGAVCHATGNC